MKVAIALLSFFMLTGFSMQDQYSKMLGGFAIKYCAADEEKKAEYDELISRHLDAHSVTINCSTEVSLAPAEPSPQRSPRIGGRR